MDARVAVWAAAALAMVLCGCGSAPRGAVVTAVDRGDASGALAAYERLRVSDGADTDLLARVAALMLMDEAMEGDAERQRAAIQELSLAGTAGAPILERIANGEGPSRVLALEALARRGDEGARRALRGLADDPDPIARATAILGMDVDLDRDALIEAIASASARAREHAAERLAGAAPDSGARNALEQAARVDPEPAVRMAAVRALGAFGPPAIGALRERLSDPQAGVRLTAVEALLRADRDQARPILGALFAVPTSAQGIEAARLLALPGRDGASPSDAGARAYLVQALDAPDPNLRSQAGVALTSIPGSEEYVGALRAALARESDPGAKLSLARALLEQRGAEEDAREALRALMRQGMTMSSLQAAAVLASERDADAAGVLAAMLEAPDAMLRRTAARALARDAMRPDDARAALRDRDATVRIGAAGGILAASAAPSA
jgi:HEAT repeat protein